MSAKFFGQWLVERNRLTPDQLVETTELQAKNNITLGEAAISLGYLNSSQVNRINIDQQRQDKRFGEIAIEKKLITEKQMQELLVLQKEKNMFFGEAAIQLGFLTAEDVDVELESHRKSQLEHESLLRTNFDDVHDPEIVRAFVDITIKLFTRMIQQTIKIDSLINTSITEIDDTCFIQEARGDKDFHYFLTLPKRHQLAIASRILNMQQDEINEIVLDATREFVNIITGSGCVKMSDLGFNLRLDPPIVLEANKPFPPHYRAVLANMNSTEGPFQIGFLFE